MVCVITVPAFHTPKLRLGLPVSFVDTATGRTLAAGIAWIDRYHQKSGPLGLIRDKGAKLPKAPVMQSFSLRFAGLNPRTNAFEIFKGNSETGAFRKGDDAFGYTVILMCLEPLLFAADLAKAAFSVAFSIGFDFATAMLIAQAVSGNIHNSKVNAKDTFWCQQLRIIKVTHSGQIPRATHTHQIHFAFSVFKQSSLVFTAHIVDLLSARKQPKGNFLIADKTQDSIIVRLRGVLAKGALFFLIRLISIRYFGNTAHCHLRGQLKFGAKLWVGQFMQIAEMSWFPKRVQRASCTPHCTAPASSAKCVLALVSGSI
jgi:hypothetical protein